jgi:6-phosphogluconolactonase
VTPEFRVLPDADAVARSAVEVFEAVAHRSVALSGGTTPRRTYELLGARGLLRTAELFLVDERCVPPYHEASNQRMIRAAVGAVARLHRIRGEEQPEDAADAYEREIRGALGAEPALDLVVLGIGSDGHTASLFPGAPELEETGRLAVATRDSHNGFRRVTLTLPVLNGARTVLFIVTGPDKAGAVARVQAGEPVPAALVRAPDTRWLLDTAAAAGIQTPYRS